MSLFNWFTRTNATSKPGTSHSGLGHMDGEPSSARHSRSKSPGASSGMTSARRSERLERRELLYAVVRESMTGAGLLSSSYKFKVLSLDSRGRQYLIMMDMAARNVSDPARLAGVETHIAKIAKTRHDLLVTAVYWRVNEHVSSSLSHIQDDHVRTLPTPRRFEPLQPSEVAAFKQALASVPVSAKLSAPGEIMKSSRRNPQPARFADTEIDERQSPLSGTQYGELN
jgi:hypothetical protein